MTTIKSFVNRLAKIGITVELFGNYPWIYLDKINGVPVRGKLYSEHGFTCFFLGVKPGEQEQITDIKLIFDHIRYAITPI